LPKVEVNLSKSLYDIVYGLCLVEGKDPKTGIAEYLVLCVKNDLKSCLTGLPTDNPLFSTAHMELVCGQ
jgi:hypothetical protein